MRLGKKPHGKAAQDAIKRRRREVELLGVHLLHRDVLPPGAVNVCQGFSDHVCGQINAPHASAGSHLLRCGEQDGPSASGDVQHVCARGEVCPLHQPLPKVGEEPRTNAVIGSRSATEHADDSFLLCAGLHQPRFSPFSYSVKTPNKVVC